MKTRICLLLCNLLVYLALAQTTPGQSSTAPGALPPANVIGSNPAAPASTNAVAAEKLTLQLQALRNLVDETLPALSAFNQQTASQRGGLAEALENVISPSKNGAPVSRGQQFTNVLSALGALVSTNAQGGLNPEILRDLATLEKDLRPVQQALQSLGLSATNQRNPNPAGGVPTPTGRQ